MSKVITPFCSFIDVITNNICTCNARGEKGILNANTSIYVIFMCIFFKHTRVFHFL